ncbi:MAG: hypothetical protein GX863_03775 [Firmicutes bacterium]|jgi:hypothetical protein|nr:hypothetical protein [Candidatus Fermentithermobacillaceae bacterium]
MRRSDLAVFVPDEIEINRLPADAVTVPVIVASRLADGMVTSLSVSAFEKTSETRAVLPLAALSLSPEEVRAGLDAGDAETVAQVSKRVAYRHVALNVGGLPLENGSTSFVTVTVDAVLSGRRTREIVRLPLHVTTLPEVPGWYGGDGHVHTQWSPDVILLPLAQRARYARDNGFGYIIITDHEDGIGERWGGAQGYCSQCRAAEDEYGIPVLPGVEIGASGGGHCLAYYMDETEASAPSNRMFEAKVLLDKIEEHNRPLSYGIVAHPFERRERWRDWSVRNLAGMEIINRSRKSRPEAVDKWFEFLRRDLSRTLRTGEFVVGVANSDCHNLMEPGGRGFTWIKPVSLGTGHDTSSKRAPLTRETVWKTLREGRAALSGSKDLGFFTLNGAGIGEIAHAHAGSTLSFTLECHPSGGRRCRKITIFSGDGGQTVLRPGRPGTPVRLQARCPRTSTFYVARFDFASPGGRRPSEVWTNPVFVRVTDA